MGEAGYLLNDNDSDFDCGDVDSDLSPDMKRRQTPYRRLSMQVLQCRPFTPPRKHSIPLVSASDDDNADLGDTCEDEEEDDDNVHPQLTTPSGRCFRVQWMEAGPSMVQENTARCRNQS